MQATRLQVAGKVFFCTEKRVKPPRRVATLNTQEEEEERYDIATKRKPRRYFTVRLCSSTIVIDGRIKPDQCIGITSYNIPRPIVGVSVHTSPPPRHTRYIIKSCYYQLQETVRQLACQIRSLASSLQKRKRRTLCSTKKKTLKT